MQPCQSTFGEPVIDPPASARANDETVFPQNLEVITEKVRRDLRFGLQLAHTARFPFGQLSDQLPTDRI